VSDCAGSQAATTYLGGGRAASLKQRRFPGGSGRFQAMVSRPVAGCSQAAGGLRRLPGGSVRLQAVGSRPVAGGGQAPGGDLKPAYATNTNTR